MKSKTIFFKICLIVSIVVSGYTMFNNIHSNYDRSVNFTRYKTFAWLNSQKSSPYYNAVSENNTKSLVDHHFKVRGYIVDTINPDVLLELALKSEKLKEEIQTSSTYNYSNYTYYNYPYNHHYNDNFYCSYQYYNYCPNYNLSTATATRKYAKSHQLI